MTVKQLLSALVLATAALASTVPPYDFTGTWLGEAHSGKKHAAMDAALTSTGPNTFTGTLALEGFTRCQVRKGTLGKRVRLHLACTIGNGVLTAKLDEATNTMRGSLFLRGHLVIFSMTKSV